MMLPSWALRGLKVGIVMIFAWKQYLPKLDDGCECLHTGAQAFQELFG